MFLWVFSLSEAATAWHYRWFADQIGAFEIHPSSDGKKSLKQMVPELPIGWSDQGTRGPMTLIGMREWQDIEAGGNGLPGSGAAGRCRKHTIYIYICVCVLYEYIYIIEEPLLRHSTLPIIMTKRLGQGMLFEHLLATELSN